jgi:hypothetical protein
MSTQKMFHLTLLKLLIPCSLMYFLFITPEICLPDKAKADILSNMAKNKCQSNCQLESVDSSVNQFHAVTGNISSKKQFIDKDSNILSTAKINGAIDENASNSPFTKDIIFKEMDKAFCEINTRLADESKWLEKKFYFIGIIVLGFFLYAMFGNGIVSTNTYIISNKSVPPHYCHYPLNEKALHRILKSPNALVVFSVAFFVALLIDMHLRNNRFVIDLNGLWVANFIEPFCGKADGLNGTSLGFIGWEQFLRVTNGYRDSSIYSLLSWPCIYLITCAFYAFYLTIHDQQTVLKGGRIKEIGQYCFHFVHITLMVCAVATHARPSIVAMKIPIFSDLIKIILPNFELLPKLLNYEIGIIYKGGYFGIFPCIAMYSCIGILIYFMSWQWHFKPFQNKLEQHSSI